MVVAHNAAVTIALELTLSPHCAPTNRPSKPKGNAARMMPQVGQKTMPQTWTAPLKATNPVQAITTAPRFSTGTRASIPAAVFFRDSIICPTKSPLQHTTRDARTTRMQRTLNLKIFVVSGNTRENYGVAVGELGDNGQASPHRLNGLPEGRKHEVAAFLEARDAVLADAQLLGHPDLRELPRVPEFAQSHLFGDKLAGALFDFLALGRLETLYLVVYVRRHANVVVNLTNPLCHRTHMIHTTYS